MGLDNREIVEVEFDEQANPTIHVKGVRGKSCKEVTKALERSLGVVTDDRTTAEFNAAPEVKRGLKH